MSIDSVVPARFVLTLVLAAVCPGLQGCGNQRDGGNSEPGIELTERFVSGGPGTPGALETQQVIRRGERRDALILVAPAAVKANLKGASGRQVLSLLAAPVFNIGDGIQMNTFLLRAGRRVPVGGRYLDPGRKAEDRDWIPMAFPLEIERGDQIEIELSAGPAGDLTADWLALSSLRLTPENQGPPPRPPVSDDWSPFLK